MSSIEQKTVFALIPSNEPDGIPILVMGIPAGGWEYIKDGKTNHFDLTKVGVPVKLVLFGGESHDAIMRALEASARQANVPILDERRRDFGIDTVATPDKSG